MSKRKDHKGRLLQPGEYQRKNLTYEYRWINGAGERKSIYAKSLSELRELESSIIKQSQTYNCPETMTLDDLYQMWRECKRGVKPETIKSYISSYDRYVMRGPMDIANMRIIDIRKSTLKKFYAMLKSDLGIKISTISNIHSVIQQIFTMAVDDELIQRNPASGAMKDLKAESRLEESISKPKREKALTKQEQDLFFDYVRSNYNEYYTLFRIMLLTGMRAGEISALQWSDVDFANAEIHLKWNLYYCKLDGESKTTIHITSPKNKKQRVIPLCEEAVMLLRERFRIDASRGRHCKHPLGALQNFVFVNQQHMPFNPQTMDAMLSIIVKAHNKESNIQLPKISSHWFRHTFATRMFEAGVQAKTVQEIMGHSDCRMTLNVYTAVTNDSKRDGMDKLTDYLKTFEM